MLGGGQMPCGVKLQFRLPSLGPDFLGLQVQVNLNNVQGSDYPYLYCVLVARPELKMLERLSAPPIIEKIVVEAQRKDDVHVLVVRQETTKTSGYHTKPADCRTIFLYALDLCRLLEKLTTPPPA